MIVAVSQTVTTTLRVSIANAGNTWTMAGTPQSTTVRVTDGPGGRNAVLGVRPLSPLGGCGSSTEISITWPGLTSGVHLARIEVDPGSLVLETTKSNNTMTATVLVGNYGIYLPLVSR